MYVITLLVVWYEHDHSGEREQIINCIMYTHEWIDRTRRRQETIQGSLVLQGGCETATTNTKIDKKKSAETHIYACMPGYSTT